MVGGECSQRALTKAQLAQTSPRLDAAMIGDPFGSSGQALRLARDDTTKSLTEVREGLRTTRNAGEGGPGSENDNEPQGVPQAQRKRRDGCDVGG